MEICDDYIRLAEDIQLGMQKEIAEKHIYIECNPSSNILIEPFDRYEQHPIFTFYPVRSIIGNKPLFVSVNTDDQGVFDTSLEEEFSLLECALRKKRHHHTVMMRYMVIPKNCKRMDFHRYFRGHLTDLKKLPSLIIICRIQIIIKSIKRHSQNYYTIRFYMIMDSNGTAYSCWLFVL